MMRCNVLTALFRVDYDTLQILLRRSDDRRWELPFAPVHPEQALETCAVHALPDAGPRPLYLEQLYTYGDPQRVPGERLISVVYFALLAADVRLRLTSGFGVFGWFSVQDLPPLMYDHDEIIAYALRRLRYKLEYTAVGFELLPVEFTLSELQRTYEIVLGEKLDKRNFRRRILDANIIEPTNRKRSGPGRPAQLYRYRPDAIAEVKTRRLFP